jgi:hypothetical protein
MTPHPLATVEFRMYDFPPVEHYLYHVPRVGDYVHLSDEQRGIITAVTWQPDRVVVLLRYDRGVTDAGDWTGELR